jgi:hypothetical protein
MITPVENGSTCDGASEQFGDSRAGLAGTGQSFLAGAGIGNTGVDDQGAHALIRIDHRQVLAADYHRCRAETVLREHAGDTSALIQLDQQQVLATGLADPRLGNAEQNAGNRR